MPKPPFDPTKPFSPAQDSSFKPAFDPSKPFTAGSGNNPAQPQNFEANSTTASTSPNAQAPQEGVLSKFWDILKNGDARTAAKLKQMGYNAPATGMDDPAYTDLVGMTGPENIVGIGKGLANAARGITSLGQDAVSGIREFLRPAAERADLADIAGRFGSKVKDPLSFQQYAEDAASAAKQQLNARQVAPRMAIQNSIADGKMVSLDPSKIQGLSPEVDQILQTAQESAARQPYGTEGADHLSSSLSPSSFPDVQTPIAAKDPAGGFDYSLKMDNGSWRGAPEVIKQTPKDQLGFDYSSTGNVADTMPPAKPIDAANEMYPGTYKPTVKMPLSSNPATGYVPQPAPPIAPVPEPTGYNPEYVSPQTQAPVDTSVSQSYARGGSYLAPQPTNTLNVPAKDAIRIRQILNDITPNFQDPNAKTTVLNAGNYVRSQLGALDPAMPGLSQGMQDAYSTQNAVFGPRGNKPALSAITASDTVPGVNKAANLQNFDQQAGSDLSGLGDNIKSVLDRKKVLSMKGLEGFLHPLQFIKEGVEIPLRSGQNAYDSLARGAYNTLSNPSDAGNLYNFLQLSNKKANSGK